MRWPMPRAALERLAKTISADVESKEAAIESKKTRLEIEKNQLSHPRGAVCKHQGLCRF